VEKEINVYNIQFSQPGKVDFLESDFKINPKKVQIQTHFSLVSPGTELAILNGGESWAPLPFVPGYASVGTVIDTPAGSQLKKGMPVFSYGPHASVVNEDVICLPIPEGLDMAQAVFARIAAVSITAIRVSEIELGDRVCVIGAGLVGNLAAQMAQLSGAEVSAIDPADKRRETAKECGISRVYESLESAVRDESMKQSFSTVIDATGVPSLIVKEAELVSPQGELILLGSPRGDANGNITDLLNKVHLCPQVVTFKGAHEWRFPVYSNENNFYKHSMERNILIIFDLIRKGQLNISPLITQTVTPDQAQCVYDGLKDNKDEYMGVVFDWRNIK